ncbi:MAG TPA: hypothetical protein VEO00_03985 [Actinomycetota bacterium]|nr:hypothetical protein [Actinomycetota bacterium]
MAKTTKKRGPTPPRSVREQARRKPGQIAPTRDRHRQRRRANIITAAIIFLLLGGAIAVGVIANLGPDELPGLQISRPVPPETWQPETTSLARRIQIQDIPPPGSEAFHIHTHLDLFVDGVEMPVPNGVGVGTTVFAGLHTHNELGTIHVESDTPFTATLGDFLDIWGVRFIATCLGGYCADGDHPLEVYVNGKRFTGDDPRGIVLKDLDEIALVYGEAPDQIPEDFDFTKDPSVAPQGTPIPTPTASAGATPTG